MTVAGAEQTGLEGLLDELAARVARMVVAELGDGPSRRRLIPVRSREGFLPYRRRLEAIKAGRLRAYQVGGRRFVDLEDEERFVASAEHEVTREHSPAPDESDEVITAAHSRRRRVTRDSEGRGFEGSRRAGSDRG